MSASEADRTRLRAAFERVVPEPAELDAVFAGAPIIESLPIDSIGLVFLVVEIEKEFSVRIDHVNMDEAFANVDSLLATISRLAKGSPVR